MTRQVLGIAGKKKSGKTTLAKTLEERGWIRMAFADEVKELALTLDPIVNYVFTAPGTAWQQAHKVPLSTAVAEGGWDHAKKDPEVRRILQVVGTEIGRAIDPNIWVNKLANRIYRLPVDAKIVVDDVRFINECNFVRHTLGGFVVRLSGGDQGDGHQSETDVDRLDPNWTTDLHSTADDVLAKAGWLR